MGKKRTHARSGNGSFDHVNRSSALRFFVFFFVFACCLVTGGGSLFAQNRFPIRHEVPGKAPLYGFINRWGKVVINPQFAQVQDFDSDYCACQDPVTGHWGLIDTTGKWVITPRYAAILTPFRCGVGAVGTATKDSTLQYVNLKGEVTFQSPHIWVNLWNPETKTYDGVRPFSEGFAVYGKADPNFPQVRILTTEGKFLTEDSYYSATDFYEGKSNVVLGKDKEKFGKEVVVNIMIDTLGRRIEGALFKEVDLPNKKLKYMMSISRMPSEDIPGITTFTDHNYGYIEIDTSRLGFILPPQNIKPYYPAFILGFGEMPTPPNYHQNPLAYYDLHNHLWIWKKERAPGKMQDISGTYVFLGRAGQPTETLVLKCPQKDVLEAYYYSSSLSVILPNKWVKRELIKLEVKDYRPTDRSFLLKFKGFKTYYPCVLRDTHTLILNNPENKLQDFVRVKY